MKLKRISIPYVVNELTGEVTLLDDVRASILRMCVNGASKTAIAIEIGVGIQPYGIMYINDLLEKKHLEKRKKGRFFHYHTTEVGNNWLDSLEN